MCRTTDFDGFNFKPRSRNPLKIKSFFCRFSGFHRRTSFPDSLTLCFLPRVNGTELQIDGSKTRPDSTAFLELHRLVDVKSKSGEAVYGSRESVKSTGGVSFEVYLRDERLLEGIFTKDEEHEWNLECRCRVENAAVVGCAAAAAADVCVAVEDRVAALSERVRLVAPPRRKKGGSCRKGRRIDRLVVIPEDAEDDDDDDESDGPCCCDCDGTDGGSSGGEWEEVSGPGSPGSEGTDEEMDLEGVGWAVDVGLWVMCLGVGYLVSKASTKRLRRMRIL
ncbi:unnamed protein product [Linum tenue]|uniref:Uncharacterized protein n=1 Tax=Linum tenue TaxID=586396 RepID=A0AAV0M7N7_9ROSI|nr:unnamed protein product [Linum tenue]